VPYGCSSGQSRVTPRDLGLCSYARWFVCRRTLCKCLFVLR